LKADKVPHQHNDLIGSRSNAYFCPWSTTDRSVRESLPDLLKQFGFTARAFSSVEDFLVSDCVDQTRCLILDVAMPRMTGPDLQRELMQRRQAIPIIFITADRDPMVRQRLIEQGAVECLFKPFSETALLEAINAALRVN
jgi:FixJ family two-component response regulator